MGETDRLARMASLDIRLSVSSNGSTWVKLHEPADFAGLPVITFSILERIDVGETNMLAPDEIVFE